MKTKRLLSLLMTLALCLSLLPGGVVPARADGEGGGGTIIVEPGDTLNELKDGEYAENHGTIVKNNGTVLTNDGLIRNNYGTVKLNETNGNVYVNYGTVEENHGTIDLNRNLVEYNKKISAQTMES